MDLTQGTPQEKHARSRKMMLWIGIGSLIMGFAGLTSAYIVSQKREDWMADLELPNMFISSTLVIILSSVTYYFAKKAMQSNQRNRCSVFLAITLGLGITFVVLQFLGFGQFMARDLFFTGELSNPRVSFVYVIAIAHIAHVVAGIISLVVVLIQNLREKYTKDNMLGLEMGATFWHFLDFLWIYLILFMTFA